MRRHTDWHTPGFELEPVAPATGPFPARPFLEVLWSHRPHPAAELALVESAKALIPFEVDGDTVRMAGEPDLTDYHSPLGPGVDELTAAFVAGLPSRTRLELDSLPLEAVEPLSRGLDLASISWAREEHAVAAVLDLPSSFEEYLEHIGKKERHEVRRKRRRYEEAVGELAHETHHGRGPGFDEFVRLHRLSNGSKGRFMTGEMADLFGRLIDLPGWRVDLLRVPGTDAASACVFGYSDGDGYYLYNSSYDPGLSDGSPGVALLGSMIERAIGEGARHFDFLKGDERYKFRLGARPRPLYRLVAST